LQYLFGDPNPPLPELEGLAYTPFFAHDGHLVSTPGYDPESAMVLVADPHLTLPPIPTDPTTEKIAAARSLIIDDLFGDFPFVADADRAHAVALFLLPYVRPLITGPTPNNLIEAPSAGSGKGLIVDVTLSPAFGHAPATTPQTRDEEEWRKRITTKLREGAPAFVIDNVTHPLDSGALASALTATRHTDRLLGANESIDLPLRWIWVTTANNPTMSTEIARRTIRIRIDPKRDQPWLRPPESFRHPNLREWAIEHRPALVGAALTLIQAWVAKGMPAGAGTLGSYERWAAVMGGILTVAGVEGFLGNLDRFYEAADLEGAVWRQFTDLWWEQYKDAEVAGKALFALALETDGIDLGTGSERSQRTAFGLQLDKQRDRVIGTRRIVFVRIGHAGAKIWRLVPTQSGTGNDPPAPAQGHLPLDGEPSPQGSPSVSPDIAGDSPEMVNLGEPSPPPARARTHAHAHADAGALAQGARRFTKVHPPADEGSDGKEKHVVNLPGQGSPSPAQTDPDAALRAWSAEARATAWEDEYGAPAWVIEEATALGITVSQEMLRLDIARLIRAAYAEESS
jgi:hypothetical protein